jgi:hypothetical protein
MYAFARAGANVIITYHAKDILATWMVRRLVTGDYYHSKFRLAKSKHANWFITSGFYTDKNVSLAHELAFSYAE